MWRRFALILIFTALLGCAVTSRAFADEPVADIAGSYAVVDAIGSGTDYHRGWLASAAIYPGAAWGIVGEVGGSYDVSDSPGESPALIASTYNFMTGPRLAPYRSQRVTPFAQVLLGAVRAGNNFGGGYTNTFAWQPGAGVDITLTHTLAVRAQTDLRLIQSSGTIKQLRLAIGVVLRR